MRIVNILIFSIILSNSIYGKNNKLYKNPTVPIERRVENLLKQMTIEEKVYQLCALRLGDGDEIFKTSGNYSIDYIQDQMGTHGVGHISAATSDMYALKAVKTANEIQRIAIEKTRLGIPTMINDEALHGIKGDGATCYPQAIALSCTWNTDLMAEIATAIGIETKSRGIRQVLSPVLDLARDPRHGRMEETFGEDPLLAARFGVAFIKNIQAQGIVCTPKHFLANFVGEGGRDSKSITISERELREIHMIPYKAAVMEGGAKSIMAAYNSIDGIPCHANKWLLNNILRKEWGFTGYTVSDWGGIGHLYGMHRVVNSIQEAAILGVKSGLDVDLPRIKNYITLIESVKKGQIKESEIDENVRRILRVKFEIGLFDAPYVNEEKAAELQDAPQFKTLSHKAARQSIVLLKNENNILPLKAGKIAVIGPNANKLQLGGYSARKVKGDTPLSAIKKEFGENSEIFYAEGCKLTGSDKSGFEAALEAAKKSDKVVLVMGGEYYVTGGETLDRVDMNLMGVQEELIKEIIALNKPTVVVLNDGRPSTISNWVDKVDGVIMMFFAGEEGGTALAEILSGKVNPSGKLSVTFPRNTGQLPMPLLNRPYGREGNFAEYPELRKESPESFVRNYRYYPLFPFGYGLSYSSFKYAEPILSDTYISKNQSIHLKIDITNESERDGDEIVQLYLSDLVCRISQPQRRLIDFKRVSIPAKTTKTVDFKIPYESLAFLNEKYQAEVEPGKFELFIGCNSLKGFAKIITAK